MNCFLAVCRTNCRHGHCLNQPGQCICHQGWTGDNCEVPLKTLIKIPKEKKVTCLNGGEYIQSECQCPSGFRGQFCRERICLHGGLYSNGKCLCPPNFDGQQCEIELKCPICRNNGRCEDNKCICPKEFIGQYCEIDIRLIQKKDKKFFSMELIVIITFLTLFISILMIISCLFYKYSYQRQKQLKQLRNIQFDKVWTIESDSNNIYKETNDKLSEKKDINCKLKQIDVHASLV